MSTYPIPLQTQSSRDHCLQLAEFRLVSIVDHRIPGLVFVSYTLTALLLALCCGVSLALQVGGGGPTLLEEASEEGANQGVENELGTTNTRQ